MTCPPLIPAPAIQMVIVPGVVVAADAALRDRHAAELGVPDDQRGVEQAARLQVGQQAGDRQVGFRGVLRVVRL